MSEEVEKKILREVWSMIRINEHKYAFLSSKGQLLVHGDNKVEMAIPHFGTDSHSRVDHGFQLSR